MPALAYHPLATEDTETIGAGRFQLEASIDRTRGAAASSRNDQRNLVLSYGLAANLDLQAGAHRAGDKNVDLKWQFFAADGFTAVLKPGVSVAAGRADPGVILAAGYETGPLEIYGHLDVRRNRGAGERASLYQASMAMLYETVERLWLIAEAGVRRQPDLAQPRNPTFALVGVIWGPTKDVDLDIGWRRTKHDPAVRNTLGLGVTVRW